MDGLALNKNHLICSTAVQSHLKGPITLIFFQLKCMWQITEMVSLLEATFSPNLSLLYKLCEGVDWLFLPNKGHHVLSFSTLDILGCVYKGHRVRRQDW